MLEDDAKIAGFETEGLRLAGFEVDHAGDGEMGLVLLARNSYDLVVLDLMLPKVDGFAVLQSIRKNHPRLPVIIVSAKRSLDDRLQGFKSGGDDYLVKPFSFEELLVRIQALLRRSQPTEESTLLASEDLTLNLLTREARRGDKRIDLQAREFSLLEILMRNPGKALSKTFILEKVWDYRFDPQTNVVDVLVCRLRSKVDKGYSSPLIHTMRGVGYVFGKR